MWGIIENSFFMLFTFENISVPVLASINCKLRSSSTQRIQIWPELSRYVTDGFSKRSD